MISRRGAPFIICGATRSRTVPQRRSNPRSNLTTPKQGSMQGARKRALRGLLFFPSLLLEKGKIGARNVFHASLPIRLVRHSCESNKTKTVWANDAKLLQPSPQPKPPITSGGPRRAHPSVRSVTTGKAAGPRGPIYPRRRANVSKQDGEPIKWTCNEEMVLGCIYILSCVNL